MQTSERPQLYVGGGVLDAADELREFVELTGIPVASTLMGLGTFPGGDPMCLDMLGMHGTDPYIASWEFFPFNSSSVRLFDPRHQMNG